MTTESSSAAGPTRAGPTRAGPTGTGAVHAPTGALDSPGGMRYRCAACGNLTRFDVVANRRTRAFHHFSVGGELTIEEVEVLDEAVEEVVCRWCGNGRAVEAIGSGPADGA